MPSLPARLPLARVPPGAIYWRVHRRRHDPIHFDRTAGARFNAPTGGFGVCCYLGDSLEVAFLEALIRGSRHRLVARRDLVDRFATRVCTLRELRLLRLHNEALVRLSLPADAPHRVPYADCQALALAADGHAETVDGVEYRSRWDDSRLCVALFDRAGRAIEAEDRVRLDDLAVMRAVLRRYEVGVV